MIVSFLQVLVVLFIIILLFGGGDRLKHALLELKSVFKSTNLTELKNTEIKTIDKTESNSLKNKKEEDKNEDNIK